jgi:predicted ATPase
MRSCIKLDTDYTHLKNYAQYLAHIKNEYSFIYPNPVIKIDFVNRSLKSYLHSIKDYKVVSESYRVTYNGKVKRGNEESEIFFLSVRNPKMQVLGFQDVGSGLSYIMPVLTSLWNHEFSIIEQPELHLHPKAQCEIGDVFISAYNKGSVALVESHSEHLLLRILRRIKETTKGQPIPKELQLKNEDVSIYYFDPVAKGHTVVKKIRVDRHGELLDLWPGGFFSERDDELFA